ncbi:MAG: hypothetical protein PF569_03915 [Candidatus Woesearchaeota archaeon]|jgi:hypothetical protein|nr:hypothetical protein [Candidatus Woesearchaeota archaeon]
MAKQKKLNNTQKKNNGFQRLFKRFSLSKKSTNGVKKVYPGRVNPKDAENAKDAQRIIPIEMNSEVQKAWNYFESNATILGEQGADYNHRIARYKELEYMIYNEGLMWTSATTYTEEAITADESGNTIGINGKKKDIEKHFYSWLDSIGISDNVLRNISWNLTVYADDFMAVSVDLLKGITEVTPLSPFLIKDRLEFNPVKALSSMTKEQQGAIASISSREKGLKDIADMLTNKKYDNYNAMYKSYLMGFVDIAGNALPPWNVCHFRRYSNHSEFAPYGRPLFIGSLARYKSFKATEMLIDSARSASFPKEIYTIKKGDDMTEVEVYQQVNRVRQMINNINQNSKDPDELTINEPIFTVDGLYDFTLKESRIDLKALGDLDAKREDLEMSTGIPPGYIKQGDRSWGNSGQNLLQQSKVFARKVYANQSAILEQLTYLYRTHLMLTGEFDGEDTEFELYMHFPVEEVNSDKMRLKSDSISLAKTILSDLGDSLGLDRGESLPVEVVQQIFSDHSFLSPEDIDKWVKIYQKSKEPIEESKIKKIKEKIKGGYLSEELVREVYFMNKKKLGLTEGISNYRHYYSSFTKNNKLLEINLTILNKSRNRKLQEISEEVIG